MIKRTEDNRKFYVNLIKDLVNGGTVTGFFYKTNSKKTLKSIYRNVADLVKDDVLRKSGGPRYVKYKLGNMPFVSWWARTYNHKKSPTFSSKTKDVKAESIKAKDTTVTNCADNTQHPSIVNINTVYHLDGKFYALIDEKLIPVQK